MADKQKKDESLYDMTMDEFDKFEHIILTNWKLIVNLGISVIIISLFAMIFMKQSRIKAGIASTTLGVAETKDELASAIKKYPSAPSADYARLRLASLHIRDGDYTKALEILTALENKAEFSEIRFMAKLNQGYALEMHGDIEKAAAKFTLIHTDFQAPPSFRAEAGYQAARLNAALGRNDSAADIAGKVISMNAGSQSEGLMFWKSQAERLVQRL